MIPFYEVAISCCGLPVTYVCGPVCIEIGYYF
ncbi:unnamed protein product [Victoria cruziana]